MKKIITPMVIAILFSANTYAEKAPTTEVIEFNEADVSTYSFVKQFFTGDKKADRILKKYHSDFLGHVTKINKEMDKYTESASKSLDKEIEKGNKFIAKDQAIYDENCESVTSEEQHQSCQDFKEQIFNLTQQVEGIKIQKQNAFGEIENDRTNRLKKTYINYKNMVGELNAQVNPENVEKTEKETVKK